MLNTTLGHLHFWPSLITINGIFFPMFLQGMAGVHRRWYDGGATYEQIIKPVIHWNNFMSVSAFLLGLAQLPFIFNFFWSMWRGERVTSDNPWHSTTVEWATPTPPGHGNFIKPIVVYRGPTNTAFPARKRITHRNPSHRGERKSSSTRRRACCPRPLVAMQIPYEVTARPDTGLYNAKLGIWLFLASEVMLFGGLFSAYIFLRLGADEGTGRTGC